MKSQLIASKYDRNSRDNFTRQLLPGRDDMLFNELDCLAEQSAHFLDARRLAFERGGQWHEIPRYIFLGPSGGDRPVKIGVFSGIHGDEPEGIHAALKFLRLLAANPELARGYCLYVYPVCNPSGFAQGTRDAAGGKDLNREFWQGSREPEVEILERELSEHQFQGIIALHTDDTSAGFYGYANGTTLSEHLLKPALAAAAEMLPLNEADMIDGFAARNAVISDCFPGVLRTPPDARPQPFDIILETPQAAPRHLKEAALLAALTAILDEYRQFIAYGLNL